MNDFIPQAFDHAAKLYDRNFTNSLTGRAQRNRVWRLLKRYLKSSSPLHILEINCGTGEDAIWLSSMGHKVTATDISEAMIHTARQKIIHSQTKNQPTFIQAGYSDLTERLPKERFDIVFSNFGGLNCISPTQLQSTIDTLGSLLKKNGKLIAVVMPEACLWEWIFFKWKGEHEKALRRMLPGPLITKLAGVVNLETWYYNPSLFAGIAGKTFRKIKARPVGIAIPPSCMEYFSTRHRMLFRFLVFIEKMIGPIPALAAYADHYFIELRKK